MHPLVAQDGIRRMFPFELFETRSASTSSAPFRWYGGFGRPVDRDIGLERFAPLPNTLPPEISAAGLATSDLSQ
jgi:hypothetical protein